MKNKQLFTIIHHSLRINNDLSYIDYCVADTVQILSAHKNNRKGGWCYKSKENLAEQLGVTRSTVQSSVKKMVNRKWLVKNECGHLRTTEKWDNCILLCRKNEQGVKKQGSQKGSLNGSECIKTAHYNYSEKDNDKGFSLEKLLPSSVKVNKETSVVLESFVNIYKAEYQHDPTIGIKEIKAVQRGIKELGAKDALQLVEDWFNSPNVSDDVRGEIMVMFSTSAINKWKRMLL